MSKTKKRLGKILKILQKRLPKGYFKPVASYSTVYNLHRACAKSCNKTYQEMLTWVEKHWKKMEKKKSGYMTTKYYQPEKNPRQRDVHNITAYSSNPVMVALDNIAGHTNRELAFLMLHEYGHQVLDSLDEKKCDKFAIRWVRKLIKEGLI